MSSHPRSSQLLPFGMNECACVCCRGEFEKRGGAGRGNWGTEAEEIKE